MTNDLSPIGDTDCWCDDCCSRVAEVNLMEEIGSLRYESGYSRVIQPDGMFSSPSIKPLNLPPLPWQFG